MVLLMQRKEVLICVSDVRWAVLKFTRIIQSGHIQGVSWSPKEVTVQCVVTRRRFKLKREKCLFGFAATQQ